MQEFKRLTPEEGIQMIKVSRVSLLPNWDIADAIVFNFVTKKLNREEKGKKEMKGAKFSEDHATLVIWLMRKGSRIVSSQPDDTSLIDRLVIKRVEETTTEEAAELGVGSANFTLATTQRDKRERLELQDRYEKVLAAYNKQV